MRSDFGGRRDGGFGPSARKKDVKTRISTKTAIFIFEDDKFIGGPY